MKSTSLSAQELRLLIGRTFPGQKGGVAILIDLPDEKLADHEGWRARRQMAAAWAQSLAEDSNDDAVALVAYRNAGRNNGELPETAAIVDPKAPPEHAAELTELSCQPFEALFQRFTVFIAPTELSATAPLKMAARKFGFRAATMPGFSPAMMPALRLDYADIHRKVTALAALLDRAQSASIDLFAEGKLYHLQLDLRFRSAHASGGVFAEAGTAGNLPSGESYIVPYEGETEPSRSEGLLPVDLDGELVLYRIQGNRAVEVLSEGPISRREREAITQEPAYANLAELGLGILAEYGIKPVGEVLLDEKLGLHIAFGRSEHFGGTVGPAQFSSPSAAVHIDRVYLPSLQPRVQVRHVFLEMDDGACVDIIRDDQFVVQYPG
ncbi:MAG: hypothetical protein RBU37_17130 [Myxococcota bacterium]|jgi:leucyl aminopeptidase (aminopeptidase T)|nr:hypothetical protein [Myxococcota bacterium]